MSMHGDRRTTLRSAKSGPPLRGCRRKPLGLRRLAGTGNQPALRKTPCREASSGNHGGSDIPHTARAVQVPKIDSSNDRRRGRDCPVIS